MKFLPLIFLLCFVSPSPARPIENEIVIIEFVHIVKGNWQEALYYYENNWMLLREEAKEKGYISDFRLVNFQDYPGREFDIILITEYENLEEFKKSEERFSKLIKAKGELELLNELKPAEFRKIIFMQQGVK